MRVCRSKGSLWPLRVPICSEAPPRTFSAMIQTYIIRTCTCTMYVYVCIIIMHTVNKILVEECMQLRMYNNVCTYIQCMYVLYACVCGSV